VSGGVYFAGVFRRARTSLTIGGHRAAFERVDSASRLPDASGAVAAFNLSGSGRIISGAVELPVRPSGHAVFLSANVADGRIHSVERLNETIPAAPASYRAVSIALGYGGPVRFDWPWH